MRSNGQTTPVTTSFAWIGQGQSFLHKTVSIAIGVRHFAVEGTVETIPFDANQATPLIPKDQPTRTYTVRWIVPIVQPPIHGGWIRMAGNTVVDLGQGPPPASNSSATTFDLGDVAILPGLINAHTHLEFSNLDQPVGTPGIELAHWIQQVVSTRQAESQSDRDAAIRRGLTESIQSGVRWVGDITTPPSQYPDDDGPMEIMQFSEVIGLSSERGDERYESAMRQSESISLPSKHHAAISPHAPYSTRPEMIGRCVQWSAEHQKPIAMHVAESPAERELLCAGTGPLAEQLQQMGVFDPSLFPASDSPFTDLIGQLSRCHRGLLIHGNDLRQAEIQQLANHPNLSVVYCPRTHHHFRFQRHPVDQMLAAGINVALGTDSRASNPDLNLWREVQFLLNHRTDLEPKSILAMATVGGAIAVGRRDLGRLQTGCRPGAIRFPTQATTVDQLYQHFAEGNPADGGLDSA